jgi:hypothetical protein
MIGGTAVKVEGSFHKGLQGLPFDGVVDDVEVVFASQ